MELLIASFFCYSKEKFAIVWKHYKLPCYLHSGCGLYCWFLLCGVHSFLAVDTVQRSEWTNGTTAVDYSVGQSSSVDSCIVQIWISTNESNKSKKIVMEDIDGFQSLRESYLFFGFFFFQLTLQQQETWM